MLVVVAVEELAAERSGVLDRVEVVGELGPVLERLEVRFAVWRAFSSSASVRCMPPPQRGVLDLQLIDRLASPWPLERLQRPRLALLAPLTQNRRVLAPHDATTRPPRPTANTRRPHAEPAALYSAVNRRRFGPSTSSGSGNHGGTPPAAPFRSPTNRSTPRPGGTLLPQLQHHVLQSHPQGSLLP